MNEISMPVRWWLPVAMAMAISSGSWLWSILLADEPKFTQVRIEKEFEPYLMSNPLLMEATGAKVIRTRKGQTIVLGVASTVLKDGSAEELIRAEKVCRVKALAALVAEKNGVQVCHTEVSREGLVVTIRNGNESATSLSEYLQTTKTKVEGIAKDMPVVGKWRSENGETYYLAIGRVLSSSTK